MKDTKSKQKQQQQKKKSMAKMMLISMSFKALREIVKPSSQTTQQYRLQNTYTLTRRTQQHQL